MLNQELLRETAETANLEWWARERTATVTRRFASRSHTRTQRVLKAPVRAFAVWHQATGYSLGEVMKILRLFGVERSHQAVFQ
jgi:putative transposase